MSSMTTARRLLCAGALAALATGVAAPAHAQPSGEGSAYGLTAIGPVAVPPLPAVRSTGTPAERSLLRTNHTKLIDAGVLDVKAAPGRASSKVADVKVPTARLFAEAVTAVCRDGRGEAHLAQASVLGRRLAVSPPPNTTVPFEVEGLGKGGLVLNKQERLPDGRLRVTGLAVDLPLPGGGMQALKVSSATCGKPARPAATPSKPGKPLHEAPAPRPVKGDLPVTG
ncbi:choice-of-anchor P family protein [Actinomadura flavalba]|uniref:choice-of-anchor P family protein n=1 Tax=Actinomadura flavalba TaxID=1120938 RepID=UPI0003776AA2|nr:choice-of-anchor P family protein [Actinomadura flavalba]